MSDNMKLWNDVAETDKRFVKPITSGAYAAAKLDTVDPTYLFRKATELWGPYGGAWGMRDLKWGERMGPSMPIDVYVDGVFFYPGGQMEYRTSWPYHKPGRDTEFCCMTHAIKHGLRMLGFTADIYLGKFADDDRVISPATGQPVDAKQACEKTITALQEAVTLEALNNRHAAATTAGFGQLHMSRITDEFKLRKSELEAKETF